MNNQQQLLGASARQNASAWARDMLALPPGQVLILDTETCDLYGEIIELAIIDSAGNELYNRRFNPLTPIRSGAYGVHGISLAMLAHEVRFDAEYPAIKAILESADQVLIYNAPFDTGCLLETCRLHAVDSLQFQGYCLMRRYAEWYGEYQRGRLKWQKLVGGDHSALGDARAALALLQRMAALETEDVPR